MPGLSLGAQGLDDERDVYLDRYDLVKDDPRVAHILLEAQAKRTARHEAEAELDRVKRERREKEQNEERKAAEVKKAAGVNALKAWATVHGSERVKTMLELNVGDWQSVAQQDFFDQHAPDYAGKRFSHETWQESGKDSPRLKPTLDELRALKGVQALCAGSDYLSDPELRWCLSAAEEDFAGVQIKPERRYCILRLTITAPDGHYQYMAIELP